MEVILKQDVEKLGKAGNVIKVKEGFARNFLIPNNLAVPVTSGNLKRLEQEKEKKLAEKEKSRREAEELKKRLENLSLTIPALAQEEDKLYGSISAQEIVSALKEEGITLDKESLVLEEPIKQLGIYEVGLNLAEEVKAKVKIWIVKK